MSENNLQSESIVEPKKVMIIEDNRVNQKITAMVVKKLGHDVIQVFEGTKGLEMIRQEKPDLVLLDIGFPDISGADICKGVKADPDLKNIPVIMVSLLSKYEIQKDLIAESGCDDHLAKPFTGQLFSQTLAKHIPINHVTWKVDKGDTD